MSPAFIDQVVCVVILGVLLLKLFLVESEGWRRAMSLFVISDTGLSNILSSIVVLVVSRKREAGSASRSAGDLLSSPAPEEFCLCRHIHE